MKTLTPTTRMRPMLKTLRTDPELRGGIEVFADRAGEFSCAMAATLAGIAVHKPARDFFERSLDDMWARDAGKLPKGPPEVVIGGGLHAAIYCAVRVRQGHEKPVVLESRERVGGVFAMSRNPAFFLNSRNRPGPLGTPGRDDGALNVLPGAIVQPSDLSGDEYQRNNDVALSIRATLAMSAKVITGVRVTGVSPSKGEHRYKVATNFGTFGTNRVVIATGLESAESFKTGLRTLSYAQFMGRMDETFPMRGMNRVAVIGAGDSGRTVIEALIGQGPSMAMSVASLDRPQRIDWYGCAETYDRERWEECNRSRYRGIGRALRTDEGREQRGQITTLTERASSVSEGFECVYVNDRPYDYAIIATGHKPRTDGLVDLSISRDTFGFGGDRPLARSFTDEDVFIVGPAAELSTTPMEKRAVPGLKRIDENTQGIFRYASRTAALAVRLPEPKPPVKPTKAKGGGVMGTFKLESVDPKFLSDMSTVFATTAGYATTTNTLPTAYFASDPRSPREGLPTLGLDSNSQKVKAGDEVRIDGNGFQGLVVGISSKPNSAGDPVLCLTPTKRGQTVSRKFPFDGKDYVGSLPKNLTLITPRGGNLIGNGSDGKPVYIGSLVEGSGAPGAPNIVLGIAGNSPSKDPLAVLAAPGGYYVDGYETEPLWGVYLSRIKAIGDIESKGQFNRFKRGNSLVQIGDEVRQADMIPGDQFTYNNRPGATLFTVAKIDPRAGTITLTNEGRIFADENYGSRTGILRAVLEPTPPGRSIGDTLLMRDLFVGDKFAYRRDDREFVVTELDRLARTISFYSLEDRSQSYTEGYRDRKVLFTGVGASVQMTVLDLKDANGATVKRGDRVQVRESSRFGNVTGVVTGTIEGRFIIDLDTDEDGAKGYTSSPGRVRLKKDVPDLPF